MGSEIDFATVEVSSALNRCIVYLKSIQFTDGSAIYNHSLVVVTGQTVQRTIAAQVQIKQLVGIALQVLQVAVRADIQLGQKVVGAVQLFRAEF